MTEYEIADMLATQQSLLMQGQAVFISVFTAYMAVAYTVGAKMTKFQVVFISIAFVLLTSLGFQGAVANMNAIFLYAEKLAQYQDSGFDPNGARNIYGLVVFCGLRVVLVLGALTFMWRARHPRES